MKSWESKKRCIRLAAVLLAAFMLAGLLGACKKDDSEGSPTDGSGTKNTTTTYTAVKTPAKNSTATAGGKSDRAASTSAESPAVTPADADNTEGTDSDIEEGLDNIDFSTGDKLGPVNDFDFGGKTIKHINSAPTNMWGDDDSKRMEYRTLYRRLMEAEKKYNFKLDQELMTANLNTELVNSTLAGVYLADIVIYSAATAYPAWVQNNVLLPLDEYIDYELPVVKANSYLYNGSLWKGRHYGYTCMYEYAFANCIFNSEVLTRNGIPDILDLVATNQWTWGAFLDAAEKCTKDFNGDGFIDQWGVSAPSALEIFRQMLYSNGCAMLVEEDGAHYYNLNREPAMRALQFVSDMSNTHKVYKQHSAAEFQKGTCAFWITDYWSNAALITAGMKTGLVPLPMGPDVSNYQNMNPVSLYGISSMCKNPREVTQIIAEAMTLWDENLNPIPMYKEVMDVYGYDYMWSPINVARRITTEKEFQVSYLPLYGLFTADQSMGYPGLTSAVYRGAYLKILDGMSVAQAVASVQAQVETILAQNK